MCKCRHDYTYHDDVYDRQTGQEWSGECLVENCNCNQFYDQRNDCDWMLVQGLS